MRKLKAGEVIKLLNSQKLVCGRSWLQNQTKKFISSFLLPSTLLLTGGKRDIAQIPKAACKGTVLAIISYHLLSTEQCVGCCVKHGAGFIYLILTTS
jgi:hypothetical protein